MRTIKRSYVLFLAMACAMVITLGLLYFAIAPPPAPRELSALDYQIIQKLVADRVQSFRRPLFPNCSWRSLRTFPAALRERLSGGILSIDVETNPPGAALRIAGPQGVIAYEIRPIRGTWEIVSERVFPKQ